MVKTNSGRAIELPSFPNTKIWCNYWVTLYKEVSL